MKQQKNRFLTPVLVVALTALATACIITTSNDSTLTVDNESSYVLTQVHVADPGDPTWGPNLLGGSPLYPGDSLTVSLDCGYYDVLIVDQDGFDCTLYDLDLCFDDAVWLIDDVELATCNF